jgi:hypothetical protein
MSTHVKKCLVTDLIFCFFMSSTLYPESSDPEVKRVCPCRRLSLHEDRNAVVA